MIKLESSGKCGNNFQVQNNLRKHQGRFQENLEPDADDTDIETFYFEKC